MPQSVLVKDGDGNVVLEINNDGSINTVPLDKDGVPTEFDTLTTGGTYGYPTGIDLPHHKIHEGKHWTVADYDNAVAIVSPKFWGIVVPADTYPHLMWRVSASLNGLVEIFRGPTVTGPGTLLTNENNNQNSSDTSGVKVYKDTTVSADGTRIDVESIGSDGASPNGRTGGTLSRDEEWITAAGTTYLVKFTSGTNDTRVSIHFGWYE